MMGASEYQAPEQISETYRKGNSMAFNLEQPETQTGSDGKRSVDSNENNKVLFEPVFDSPYNLSYACLLIPRFHNHYLVGDLAECLHIWMQQICISYDWRLDYIYLQPEYMQWLIDAPVSTSPVQIIRAIRQQTSKNIFEDFPKYKKQNVGKDFWAPAHLVIVGKQLHSAQIVQEFILLTRQQQAAGSLPPKKR